MENNNMPKYSMVENYIKEYIYNKNLEKGDLLPSENKIAKKLNIHPNTVKTGLNNLVKDGIIYREQGKGTFVADFKEEETHQTIGIIVEDLFDESPLSAGIVKGVDRVLSGHHISYLLGISGNKFNKIRNDLKKFYKRSVAGIIFMPLQYNKGHLENYRIIDDIVSKNIPLVLVDRYIKGLFIDYITSDNENGAYQATKHLLELGHEEIVFIVEPYCSTIEERIMGYKLALAEASIKNHIIIKSDKRLKKAGQEGVEKLLSNNINFSALICSNDLVARGAISTLQKHGLSIPEDVSIVGYDDAPIARIAPSLTTVRQPVYEMGKKAAEILIDKINGSQNETKKVILPGELIIRNSTSKRLSKSKTG